MDRLARYRESVGRPQRARWMIGAAVAGVVIVAVVVGLLVSGSGGGHSSAAEGTNHDTTGSGGPSTVSTDRPNGVVVADTSGHYGQSPSSGTCAHWSQRFVNHSDARVLRISFAPVGAVYTKGTKGRPGYRTWPAVTPPPAQLNVSLDPNRAAVQQFMICTSTAPPAPGVSLVISPPSILRWIWQDGISASGKLGG